MTKDKIHAHCARCRHQQIFVRADINHGLHLLLALVTGGLWLALCIGKFVRPWRCEHCGWHKPESSEGPQRAKPTKAAKPVRIPLRPKLRQPAVPPHTPQAQR